MLHEPFFFVYGRDALLPMETVISTYPNEPITEKGLQDQIMNRIEVSLGI